MRALARHAASLLNLHGAPRDHCGSNPSKPSRLLDDFEVYALTAREFGLLVLRKRFHTASVESGHLRRFVCPVSPAHREANLFPMPDFGLSL